MKTADNNDKGMSVLLKLNLREKEMLSIAAEHSGRSKTKEAHTRLIDHLTYFTEIGTVGRRFEEKVDKQD